MRKRIRKHVSQSAPFHIPFISAPIYSSHDEPYHGPGRSTFDPNNTVNDGGNLAQEIPNTGHVLKFHLCCTALAGNIMSTKLLIVFSGSWVLICRLFLRRIYGLCVRCFSRTFYWVRYRTRSVRGSRQCVLGPVHLCHDLFS